MILLKDYESLDDVLIHIKLQVLDSLNYAGNYLPAFSNPEDLFYFLKDRVKYIDDPSSIELLMSMETMMSGSRTGIPGGGDCDDFTITGLASLLTSNFVDNQIVLTGMNKNNPSHIYVRTKFQNNWYIFDLTNPNFNQERKYKFFQYLTFKL